MVVKLLINSRPVNYLVLKISIYMYTCIHASLLQLYEEYGKNLTSSTRFCQHLRYKSLIFTEHQTETTTSVCVGMAPVVNGG